MFLLRVVIPDRPGSLGALATALGTVGADISALEVAERSDGYVVDDFMLHLPPASSAENLYTACAGLEGVDVLWVSYYPEGWGLQSDVDTLERMLADPASAEAVLVASAPQVFHTAWAVRLDAVTQRVLDRTDTAPDLDAGAIAQLSALQGVGTFDAPAGWASGWPQTVLAHAPLPQNGHLIVTGRNGGPEFLASELARLKHLAALAADH